MFLSSSVRLSYAEAEASALFYVKVNKTVILFVLNGFKPLDHGCRVFPLVVFGCSRDFVVDSVEDCFADSVYLGFGGVH